jgi:hypothetical protein
MLGPPLGMKNIGAALAPSSQGMGNLMRLGWLLAAAPLLLAQPALAENLNHKFSLQAQVFFPGIDSSVRVDQNNGDLGTVVDFENDLDLNKHSTVPSFRAGWRINDDWMFIGEYYALNRDSTATLDRDIIVGDTTYPVSGSITGGFDSDIYRFTINNLILQRENLEVALAIGFHGTDFKIFVEGDGEVNGVPGQFRSESRSVFAPLPTIGAMVNWEVAPRVTLGGRFDWLSLSIDEYSGRLVNTEISAAYAIHKNIDVGLLYRLVDYEVKVRKDDWNGRVDYQFSGPAIFVELGF